MAAASASVFLPTLRLAGMETPAARRVTPSMPANSVRTNRHSNRYQVEKLNAFTKADLKPR